MKVKKIIQEWEIWKKMEEAAKFEENAKKLVFQRFHKCIHVFRNKISERMPIKKICDHVIEVKKRFLLRKREVYLLLRKERGEVDNFIRKKLIKVYIRHLKLSQIAHILFVEKKDSKKYIVQDYIYLNKNNYPLPLISDIIENISTKRVFTKLDL